MEPTTRPITVPIPKIAPDEAIARQHQHVRRQQLGELATHDLGIGAVAQPDQTEVDESWGAIGEDAEEVEIARDHARVDVEGSAELEESPHLDLPAAHLRDHAPLLMEERPNGAEVGPRGDVVEDGVG
jgi:hypothetical protein